VTTWRWRPKFPFPGPIARLAPADSVFRHSQKDRQPQHLLGNGLDRCNVTHRTSLFLVPNVRFLKNACSHAIAGNQSESMDTSHRNDSWTSMGRCHERKPCISTPLDRIGIGAVLVSSIMCHQEVGTLRCRTTSNSRRFSSHESIPFDESESFRPGLKRERFDLRRSPKVLIHFDT